MKKIKKSEKKSKKSKKSEKSRKKIKKIKKSKKSRKKIKKIKKSKKSKKSRKKIKKSKKSKKKSKNQKSKKSRTFFFECFTPRIMLGFYLSFQFVIFDLNVEKNKIIKNNLQESKAKILISLSSKATTKYKTLSSKRSLGLIFR